MEKHYSPTTIEQNWRKIWEQKGYFKPNTGSPTFCIMLPPPNVTGTLHMGHGFQMTLMDALIRKNRMMGLNTLWQGGTDHAGIATQMVVERQLAQTGQTRVGIGREAFLKKAWEWREQSGQTITQQIRRLGASIDWSRERFTLDKDISYATHEAFIRLYEEGLIYRGKRLVNWDPQLHTAISDLEVVTNQEQGHLWHIRYPLVDSKKSIVVATTRPETLLGDTAVAVHPDDKRYKSLIGKKIKLPLTEREIPIIADEKVEPEFGTGAVKVTPAHDFNDYEIGQRHQLPMINIFTLDAKLNENAPEKYRGLERFDARKIMLADLQALNLIEKIEPYTLNVPRGDRSGMIIEPLLTDQWFVKTSHLAPAAIEAVEKGKIHFVPPTWKKNYLQWLEQIQDWCISRQLWWGHRIPIWYDENNKPYVGHNEDDVRKRYQLSESIKLEQDSDVLDTWFSASLWPFATLGWPSNTKDLELFFPTQVLVTGFDIIFFWVARMIMMSLHLTGKIPFETVYITGLIRDRHGNKMSKTKGNILDPIDLIDGIELDTLIKKRCQGLMQPQMAKDIENNTREEFPQGIAAHGTDALRFTFCALATHGRNINFDMGRIEGYRNFCNKLWNASRFVLMNTENQNFSEGGELSIADRWILSALQNTIQQINQAYDDYRFDLIAQHLYEFIWNEYCDWYLELAKTILNNSQATINQTKGTRRTLLMVLETILRLMHPIMPFITEEIWHAVAKLMDIKTESLMLASYPKMEKKLLDPEAEKEIQWLKEIVTTLRNVRSEMNISPAKKIVVFLHKGTTEDKKFIEKMRPYITALAKIETLNWREHFDPKQHLSASALFNSLEIYIPLAGIIDQDAEMKRLQKEIDKLRKEKERSVNKLKNTDYLKKAPQEIVQKEQLNLSQTQQALDKLLAKIALLK